MYSSVESRWTVQAAQRRRSHHSKTHSSASQLLPVFSTALSSDCFSVSPSCSKFTLLPNTVARNLKTCSVLTIGHPVGVTVTLQWSSSLALSSVFTQPPWHASDAGLSLWKARENCEIGRTAFSLPSQSYNPTFTASSLSLSLSRTHSFSHTVTHTLTAPVLHSHPIHDRRSPPRGDMRASPPARLWSTLLPVIMSICSFLFVYFTLVVTQPAE